MARHYIKKPSKHWSNRALQDALVERRESGTSIRKLSAKYNVPKSNLERHISAVNKGVPLRGQGRKPVFSLDEARDLKECIVGLASLGFGMRLKDVAELVESYVMFSIMIMKRGRKILNSQEDKDTQVPTGYNNF